jgi:nitronate monooxygenase
VVGTRFLLTPESRAHPAYRARLLAAEETLLTERFGLGWPAPVRVVRNAATERADDEPLAPVPPTDDGLPELVEEGPLYAGETVARIRDVRPAGELVRELTP